jgi:hypothetical protein
LLLLGAKQQRIDCSSKNANRGYNKLISTGIGGMMVISVSPSAHATVKRMQSRPSGMTLVSTDLRRHVGSELVEPGALSGLLGGVQVE